MYISNDIKYFETLYINNRRNKMDIFVYLCLLVSVSSISIFFSFGYDIELKRKNLALCFPLLQTLNGCKYSKFCRFLTDDQKHWWARLIRMRERERKNILYVRKKVDCAVADWHSCSPGPPKLENPLPAPRKKKKKKKKKKYTDIRFETIWCLLVKVVLLNSLFFPPKT